MPSRTVRSNILPNSGLPWLWALFSELSAPVCGSKGIHQADVAFVFIDTDLGARPDGAESRLCLDVVMKSHCESEHPGPDPDPGPIPPDPSPFPPPPVPDPQPSPTPPTRPPIPHLLGALSVGFGLLGGWSIGSAQPASELLPVQQAPAVVSPVPPIGAPQTSGLPAKITTPATTNRLAPTPRSLSGATGFTGAGRGLPGMPGGPPLTSPLGARDPSSRFMRPPTIGPLFCDPALEFPC